MLHSLKTRLRRRGHHVLARRWTVEDVDGVLRACAHGSALSGRRSGDVLTVLARDPERPLTPDNALVLTWREACSRPAVRAARAGARGAA
jgi:hypothetical protein